MIKDLLTVPGTSPERIFSLRDGVFANDLFITAITHFDFFNWLGKNPSGIDVLCKSLNIKRRPADVMLTLFKAYEFVEEREGTYSLSLVSKDYLRSQSAFDLTSFVTALKDRPVVDLMRDVLLTGKPGNWSARKDGKEWATAMEDEAFAESFSAGMNSRGGYLANGVAKVLDLNGRERILDIGGASGIYSAVLVATNPGVTATVYEKPPVDKIAKHSIKNFGLEAKMDVMAGDMFKENFPAGYDVHFVSHVLHDWDLDDVLFILKNSFAALKPGGIIVIHDAHINEMKNGPLSVAEYSVLLMFSSEGKCYSITEMEEALKEVGFKNIQYKPTILNRSIMVGQKPR